MLIDINLDEFNNTVITNNTNNKSITTDTEYWQIRNYMVNKFCRNNSFWNKYKGKRIYDSAILERTIEEEMKKSILDEIKNKVKIIVLNIGAKLEIFAFYINKNINAKDILIFDFNVII